jgi:HEAT repeat protein
MLQQPPPPPKPQPLTDEKYGSASQIMALPLVKLIAVLQDPQASVYAKAKVCQRLAVVGDKTGVPALAALLTDPQLSHYARFALEPIPDPAADAALLAALGKVKGPILIGVINSLGQRKSSRALDPLGRLLRDSDPAVAQAASAALARIRPPL